MQRWILNDYWYWQSMCPLSLSPVFEAVIRRGDDNKDEDTRDHTTDYCPNVHTTHVNVNSPYRKERGDLGTHSLTSEEIIGELLGGGEDVDLMCHQQVKDGSRKVLTRICFGLWSFPGR